MHNPFVFSLVKVHASFCSKGFIMWHQLQWNEQNDIKATS